MYVSESKETRKVLKYLLFNCTNPWWGSSNVIKSGHFLGLQKRFCINTSGMWDMYTLIIVFTCWTLFGLGYKLKISECNKFFHFNCGIVTFSFSHSSKRLFAVQVHLLLQQDGIFTSSLVDAVENYWEPITDFFCLKWKGTREMCSLWLCWGFDTVWNSLLLNCFLLCPTLCIFQICCCFF